jgi:hypothetical protein
VHALEDKKMILSRGEIEYKVNAKLTIKNGHNKEAWGKKNSFVRYRDYRGVEIQYVSQVFFLIIQYYVMCCIRG